MQLNHTDAGAIPKTGTPDNISQVAQQRLAEPYSLCYRFPKLREAGNLRILG